MWSEIVSMWTQIMCMWTQNANSFVESFFQFNYLKNDKEDDKMKYLRE